MSAEHAPGRAEVIALLNECLTAELTAINQYFLHAKMLSNWGFKSLAKKIRDESIDEMKHADELIERVLYLEGLPNLQRLWGLRIGESPRETLACDLALEDEAIPRLNAGIETCRLAGDNGSRLLLEKILHEEEAHRDWIVTQLAAMDRIGESAYLAEKL